MPGTTDTYDFTLIEGDVTQGGTAASPANMQKIEQGITDAHEHIALTNNPHNVTAEQIGLDSMVSTTGEVDKIVKTNPDGDIAAGRYLKVSSNYIRFNNNVLEVSSDGTIWKGVGASVYNKFNVINFEASSLPTALTTIASFTGSGIIREIVATNTSQISGAYNIYYSIDGGVEQQISRPTATNYALGKGLAGSTSFNGVHGYDLPVNLTFNSSFTVRANATGSNVNSFSSSVKYNYE
ncbi:hypothetical protein IMX26_13245 [Clostridium sp. 'deep sea']|uniref:hypothetical protein n=1 Tax=Clostridium sp. 'deep sea' TaxID=2779445 RepID=UPI00189696C8|nr:hypothetical protein [Clostridium sp. 'deep sea']QOR34447.1 hypothetical protein IMX26_13245 [Clostridium sp. 'deep sea']